MLCLSYYCLYLLFNKKKLGQYRFCLEVGEDKEEREEVGEGRGIAQIMYAYVNK
jgi:hypothetical protein